MRIRVIQGLLLIAVALTLSACGRSIEMRGSFIQVTTLDGRVSGGEFLALQDSILTMGDPFRTTSEFEIRYAELKYHTASNWQVVFGGLGLIAGIIFFAGLQESTSGAWVVGLVGLVLSIGSYVGFELTEPQSKYIWPLDVEERDRLTLYARYPHGIDQELLKQYRSQ